MAFEGFERDRETLKCRCPAAAGGFDCAGRAACLKMGGSKAGDYGRVVRIPLATADRRIFTPTPWGSPSWQRGYNRWSASTPASTACMAWRATSSEAGRRWPFAAT